MTAIIISASVLLWPGTVFDVKPIAARSSPQLPDLVMAPFDVMPGFSHGIPLIRFPATIGNLGDGEFAITARRTAPWTDDWVVRQRISEAGGGFSSTRTEATLVFAGDQHNHWHVAGLESHRLERVDTGEVVGQVLKQGFCPFDTNHLAPELPGSPAAAVYPEFHCGTWFAVSLRLGISVGWGDEYPWNLLQQQISVEGLEPGRYRVVEVADPFDWFEELDETNNVSWVEFDFEMHDILPDIEIVGRSPEH